MIKVRFNLGRGENFRKWKISYDDNRKPIHLDPDLVQLLLYKPKLMNRKKSAETIHKGANKFVCAWIECEDVLIGDFEVDYDTEVSYNPRIKPYWMEGIDNADLREYEELVTKGNRVFRQLVNKN